jgi:hypothetical protein
MSFEEAHLCQQAWVFERVENCLKSPYVITKDKCNFWPGLPPFPGRDKRVGLMGF